MNSKLIFAVEVKYQPKITSRDLYGIIDFKKITDSSTAIVLSKETLEVRGNVHIIPIWLFLLIA
jgi:predicted AAA+ superfamily ATPase